MILIEKIIELRCPTLFALPVMSSYIELAKQNIGGESVFGNRYSNAVALLACHLYTSDRSSSGGISGLTDLTGVSSMSEAQLSISFDKTNGQSSFNGYFSAYNTTRYGKELIILISGVVFCPMNRIVQ